MALIKLHRYGRRANYEIYVVIITAVYTYLNFRYGAAIQDCDTALELDNTYIKAYARRATAKQSLGRLKEAMEDYEHLLKLQPGNKQALDGIEKVKQVLKVIAALST